MAKLTEGQTTLLKRFGVGSPAVLLTGRQAQAFFYDDLGANINLNTLFALIKRGHVSQERDRTGHFDLKITEAGRRALEGDGS